MDPNANLSEQSYLLGYGKDIDKVGKRRMRELRQALLEWMQRGGFEPDWAAYPEATQAFNRWRIRTIGY